MTGQQAQDRQGECEPGHAAEALMDDGVESQRQRDHSSEREEPAQRDDRRSDRAVQRRRPLEAIGEVEHADGLECDDRRGEQHSTGQQRARIGGSRRSIAVNNTQSGTYSTNATRNEMPVTAIPSSAGAIDEHGDQTDADNQADDATDDPDARLRPHGQLPRQAAGLDQHLAQRPAGGHHPDQAEEHGDPAGRVGLGEGSRNLGGERALDAGGIIDLVGLVLLADEAEDADSEEHERDEEQEQPEGDGAADKRAGRLPVAPVHPHQDVDDRPTLVPLQQLRGAGSFALVARSLTVIELAASGTSSSPDRLGRAPIDS